MNGFLEGCGLPAAWAGQPQWRILETSFGFGHRFFSAWRAWRNDPDACRLLHYVAIEPCPLPASEILNAASSDPAFVPLARALADQWVGLVPGVHRLVFEEGRVMLTLHVRAAKEVLRREPFTADSVWLVVSEAKGSAEAWDLHTFKAAARHCRRGTRMACRLVTQEAQRALAQCGFTLERSDISGCSHIGLFNPHWEPKARRQQVAVQPGHCAVVGAGLAGAAVAASLARRGWRVTVLDAADAPASGASGLPAGLLAPHHSPDDNLLSRLSRSGVRITLEQARSLLRDGEDWRCTGVLQHRVLDPGWVSAGGGGGAGGGAGRGAGGGAGAGGSAGARLAWMRPANAEEKAAALLSADAPAGWHEQAAWIKPAVLVRRWLAQPGVDWRGNTKIATIAHDGDGWRLADEHDKVLARAQIVVVAAALGTADLIDARLPLQPVRGQVSWREHERGQSLPPFPVNGLGHFIPNVPWGNKLAWFCGSTYERDETELAPRAADDDANLTRLQDLLPAVAAQLQAGFASGSVQAWTGVRCASANRRPLLGELQPGLWVSTAMGSRGLTFAALCAEVLAARLHDEPLPLEQKLMHALMNLCDHDHGRSGD